MDSPRGAVDLGRELTCSICTELLYQPLTLLDCLHTFDGACLKEWFSWQAAAAESSPTPPDPNSPVFTCPSCRAPVRDTRHNATVATLLDMFLSANPDKAKPDNEKEEMDAKYKPGDRVLPKLNLRERSAEQMRQDEEDRRLLQEVRELSLREALVNSGNSSHSTSRTRRARGESRSRDGRTETRSARPSREGSREPSRDSVQRDSRARDARQRARRQAAEASVMLTPELPHEEGRRRRSESRQRSNESARRRPIEHQSSIRSLISRSSNNALDSRDLAREIEEFTRQIQEEGLLDGVDLDNINLNTNDELSRRITEAYRRRHRERARQEGGRRSNASAHSHRSTDSGVEPRPQTADSSRPSSRHQGHPTSRPSEERGRYPPSSSHLLEVQEPRRRRRTTSGGRSATVPIAPTQPETRTASRSQTDLGLRSQTAEYPPSSTATRPSVMGEGRSSSTPTVTSSHGLTESSSPRRLPFSAHMSATGLGITQNVGASAPEVITEPARRSIRPSSLIIGTTSANFASPPSETFSSPPLTSPRTRAARYAEPNITCRRCEKEHIEYDLHYNCAICDEGRYNICLDCYRQGKGCLHWYGFGRGAWVKWEQARKNGGGPNLPEPHLLKATRYLPPKSIPGAGGADGRRTMTTENPLSRLQSGAFCSRCLSWANECYWRCDLCNDGDWGFCNDCVNQGRCCMHPLLPLGFQPSADPLCGTPPASPTYRGSPQSPRPPTASVLTGPNVVNIGPYVPLTFNHRCDACHLPIAPTQNRHHCYACPSPGQGVDSGPGDYNICEACYAGLIRDGGIAYENGIEGWRRCPQGHRMVVIHFVDGPGGQRRIVAHDWVGGRMLRVEMLPLSQKQGLQIWSWKEGPDLSSTRERLVAVDVGAIADASGLDPTLRARLTDRFPSEGGSGLRMLARWAWYPNAGPAHADELLFPKGAEITEVDRFDEEWFHGTYMGAKGIFPAPYVRPSED